MSLLYLIVGPMFSGKTTWVQSKMNWHSNSRSNPLKHITIKFNIDARTPPLGVLNHDGVSFNPNNSKEVGVTDLNEFLDMDFSQYDIIAIDELHIELLSNQKDLDERRKEYLDDSVYKKIFDLVYRQNKIVFISMNDFWVTGEVVAIYAKLQRIATHVEVLRAVCDRCKRGSSTANFACMSEKIVDNDETLEPGGPETWIAVCAKHWSKAPK